jgi:hypothetical protein
MRKYIILNKYGRPFAVADSFQDIAIGLGVSIDTVEAKYQQGKPIHGKWLVMLREKHEYLWHKYGGIRKCADDHFAFCTPEELRAFKENEKRTFLDICDKYKPMRL